MSVLYPVLRILCVIGFVLAGLEAVGVASAYTVSVGVVSVLSVYFVYRYTTLFEFGSPADLQYRSLLSFSVPLFASSIVGKLMNNTDTLLISTLGITAAAGQYNVAFILSQTMILFLETLGFMYLPEISELYDDGRTERAAMIYRTVTKWVMFLSIPFVLTAVAFPEYIITFIYSNEYEAATVPFLILAGGFVTHLLNGPNHGTLTAFGDTREIFLLDTVTVGVNIVLNLALIPEFGVSGAATATAVSYLVRNTVVTIYLYREYSIVPFSRWLFVPLSITVLTGAVLRWLVPAPSFFVVIAYSVVLIATIVLAYLSSGIEQADILLAEILEENLGVDLDPIRRLHDILQ